MNTEIDNELAQSQIDQELNTEEEKHILEQKQQILDKSGVLKAYEYFLTRLCKDGFPQGNPYEYAAQIVLKYEKKKQAEQFRQQTMAKSLADLQQNEKQKAQLQLKNETKNDGKTDQINKNKSPQKVNKDQKEQKEQKDNKNQKEQVKGKDDKKESKIQQDQKQKKK